MTAVYLTIDTELSSAHFARHGRSGLEDNFAQSIIGRSGDRQFGIHYQMDRLDAFGLKAVFFVDPMPALVVGGADLVRRIVDPILTRGHDVQLHLHTEWLAFADRSPTPGRTGQNMADFTLMDQVRIIAAGRELLMAAGAPAPTAFRAGNYGANDDTLRALTHFGIGYDSSFCPGILHSCCRITLPPAVTSEIRHCGVTEMPVGTIASWAGQRRHAQLTALSAWELEAAIGHAGAVGLPSFTLVSHSFELMSRDRRRENPLLVRRFEALCRVLAEKDGVSTATYRDNPPRLPRGAEGSAAPLRHNPIRTASRMGEQMVINQLYGERGAAPPLSTWPLHSQLLGTLHQMVPLQNLALDALTAL